MHDERNSGHLNWQDPSSPRLSQSAQSDDKWSLLLHQSALKVLQLLFLLLIKQ